MSEVQDWIKLIGDEMKICCICKEEFAPFQTTQKTCGLKCAVEHVQQKKERNLNRDIAKAKKVARKALRERKQALKSKAKWLSEAQAQANAYTRKIDAGMACISCGLHEHELNINNPIAMVCGHYLSVGSHPELRFHDFNRNLQCTRCNGGAGKYGKFNNKEKTVTQNYRANLIKKIGLDNVLWLEGPQKAQNLIIEDIIEIKEYFKEQTKLLCIENA